jgi:hypothetical protein
MENFRRKIPACWSSYEDRCAVVTLVRLLGKGIPISRDLEQQPFGRWNK